jgi:hypothetical protein
MKIVYSILLCTLLLSACTNDKKVPAEEEEIVDSIAIPLDTIATIIEKEEINISDLTQTILQQIKNKDYVSLIQYIHPDSGLRFSPYGYINPNTDIVIRPNEFRSMVNDPTKLVWGAYDGSGDEIIFTFKEYFDKFVYNVDFLKAEKLSINKSAAKGNSLNNIMKVYPNAEYTESYFSGFDKKYDGMDWQALRLVYRKDAGKYYLIGIVHDQWTI